ncbi:helix-turn-helix domain-containing protein [Flavobacterium sp. LS1R47]|uniref:Helix-turn-helix domain-containing protein n=1 Tax=Flavobacterium frigoritolerans TaxID=2987686 RepID=A0A9X2ZK50_9FLAO|nr:helix-turn-helix domain-containing protein [Flavobacterium frigoritolerans]MCV9932881.1 helix-turn-helix domain-containing protein [Flavobacterium frigoritolerans]
MVDKKSKYYHPGLQVNIFEKFTSQISFSQLFKIDHFSILLVNSGSLSLQINNRKIDLIANDLIIIPKKAICEILFISNQLQICQTSFTSDFAFGNSIKWPHIKHFEFFITQISSKIILKKKDAILVIDLFTLIKSKIASNNTHVYKKEILLFSFNLLLYELAGIYHRSSWHLNVKYSRNEALVIQFFKILEINSRKQHNVKFYADDLHITAGHLTKIVKKVTQKTAKEFITQSIVLEAKILLQDNQLSIFYIIEELQFTNSSSFCTFFKKHTSLSPSEYRSHLNPQ